MIPAFKLTAVGVGPGDPELITLKGVRKIQAADLICFPNQPQLGTGRNNSTQSKINPILQATERLFDAEWQLILKLTLPILYDPTLQQTIWRKAAQQIIRRFNNLAKAQPRRKEIQGVYLLYEDPLLYGGFISIWQILLERQPEMKIEIVPGVASFGAAAAAALLPLSTSAEQTMIFCVGHALQIDQLAHHLAHYETVILLNAGPHLPEISAVLERLRLGALVYFIEYIGLPNQLIFDNLHDLQDQRRSPYSVLIVRKN